MVVHDEEVGAECCAPRVGEHFGKFTQAVFFCDRLGWLNNMCRRDIVYNMAGVTEDFAISTRRRFSWLWG